MEGWELNIKRLPEFEQDEPLVALGDYADPSVAEVVAIKLRAFGIPAQAQGATVKGVVLPAGNVVWVHRANLELAQALIDDP